MDDSPASAAGFHAGELAVQQRAGVRAAADRLTGMLDLPDLGGGIHLFLAQQTFAALTGRDRSGRLWVSPLSGPPGFLEVVAGAEVRVHSVPPAGDPLHAPPAGGPVGMIVMDFARRRRLRINGTLTRVDGDGLAVRVDQAFGNCPKYIHPRVLNPAGQENTGGAPAARRRETLDAAAVALIQRADTFLLGTIHPDRGADTSHRGGPPGFVRVPDDRTLRWPDYPGNNMFNSLGNLAVDPATALLFVDFTTGDTVHLSGTAGLEWDAGPGDDGGTGRRVRFTVEDVIARRVPLRAGEVRAGSRA